MPIPQVDGDLNIISAQDENIAIVGFNVETKIYRTQRSDIKIYADVQQMVDRGRGYSGGVLLRQSFGQPATSALRVRAEGHYFEPNYLPQFFDTFYDIQKLQYMPAGYRSSDNLVYYPTKLGFLDAMEGGKMRLGGYLSITYSILNKLTVGLSTRFSQAIGRAKDPAFSGPRFDDISQCPLAMGSNRPDCMGVTPIGVDPRFASLRLHVEVPFRDFLQTFATYEVFGTSLGRRRPRSVPV